MISVCLLLTAILVVAGTWQQEYDRHKDEAQIIISNISDNDIEKLEQHPQVVWLGEQAIVGASKQNGITLVIRYEDEVQIQNQSKIQYKGELPKAENEIMVSGEFLDAAANSSQIGDLISLDLTGEGVNSNYVISGIYMQDEANNQNDSNRYQIFISKLCAVKLVDRENLNLDTYVRLHLDKDTETEANSVAFSIIQDFDILENDVFINPDYPFGGILRSNYKNTLITVLPVLCLLLMLAGTVIYSIFSIAVTGKVRVYGQLRTIGMTRKQIRLLVRREALILALKGISGGLPAGCLMGYLLHPAGFRLASGIIWSLIICAFTLLMVVSATSKPAKIASRISPLEGAKYSPYHEKEKAVHKLQRKMTILNLAVINLGRNRRKTITTISAMSLCGISLVIFSSFGQSYSALKAQRFYFYPHGDMQVNISSLGSSSFVDDNVWREGIVQYLENPLTDELMKQISDIEGVVKVSPATGIYVNIERMDGWADSAMQPSISREQFQEMKAAITDGDVDYEALVKERGIMVANSEHNTVQPGDVYTVAMVGSEGKTVKYTMPVMALYDQDILLEISPVVPIPEYLFAEEMIKELTNIENDFYCFEIDVDPEREQEVELQLRQIVNQNENLELNCVQTSVTADQESTDSLVNAVCLFIYVLFIFSIINLINTALSNMYSRRRELGMLQAQGMTSAQINRMLQIENLFYTMGAGMATLLIGSCAGYRLCKAADVKMHCISYQYPVMIVLGYLGSLIIVQCLLSAFAVHNLKKESVIDRIASD